MKIFKCTFVLESNVTRQTSVSEAVCDHPEDLRELKPALRNTDSPQLFPYNSLVDPSLSSGPVKHILLLIKVN